MIIVTNSDIMGKNIRYLRRRKWMSRRKLSGLVRLPVEELKRIEEGKTYDIDSIVLSDICWLFHVEMQTILTEHLKK